MLLRSVSLNKVTFWLTKRDLPPQASEAVVREWHIIEQDAAGSGFVEAGDQARERALAAAGRAHQGDGLSGQRCRS